MRVTELDYDDPAAVAEFFALRFNALSEHVDDGEREYWEIVLPYNLIIEVGYNSLDNGHGVDFAVGDTFEKELLFGGGWRGADTRDRKAAELLRAVIALRDIL